MSDFWGWVVIDSTGESVIHMDDRGDADEAARRWGPGHAVINGEEYHNNYYLPRMNEGQRR